MKKFLIIGNMNAITYKDLFYHIKSGEIYCGYNFNKSMKFKNPYEDKDLSVSVAWWQNLKEIEKPYVELTKDYVDGEYKKYDNYDAINVDRSTDIPRNYFGEIGVPITFFNKLNRNQFEITGIMQSFDKVKPFILGKLKYARLLIRRKK